MRNDEQQTIRLLFANEHPIMREGMRAIVAGCTDIELVDYAPSIAAMLRQVGEIQPDVLLMDPYMSQQDGLRAIRLISGEWPRTRIVVFTMHDDDEHLWRALRCGISAYLTWRTEQVTLLHTIRAAARGETILSPGCLERLLAQMELTLHEHSPPGNVAVESKLTGREREVLQRVASGERNKEIAARLGISEPTVKSHLASIYFKLGVDSRASAVAVALERGLLSFERKR
jgi:NarL family two-component system response regulator YdfI